jgi:glycerol kinase
VPAVAEAAAAGDCLFGTVDSWLIYNLTGGKEHMTDGAVPFAGAGEQSVHVV